MSDYTKYTKEILEPLVQESVSVAEVLRKLGKRQSGSIATHLSKVIAKFEIDTSHFLGQAANCGSRHKGGPEKKRWQDVLIANISGRREKAFRLRRALVESGREYKCDLCQLDEWMGQKITLQVDHQDGDCLNNSPTNVRFLCPNCHSQTDNHSGSKGLTDMFGTARAERERRKRWRNSQ